MVKRTLLTLAVMLILIAALGFVKFRQIQTAMAHGAAFQPPPTAVTTIVAAQEAAAGSSRLPSSPHISPAASSSYYECAK